MNSRSSAILLILILHFSFTPIAADPIPPAADGPISLNFQNTDIDMVLKFVSDVTGYVFVKSDSVRGFVTVMSPGKVSGDEVLDILQTVLDLKGFTLVRGNGKIIRVVAQSEAAQTGLEVGYGAGELPDVSERMITQVIPLKFVSNQDLKTQLAPLVSKNGSLIADDRMNAIVITDMTSNIRRLLKMIAALDVRTPQVLIEALIMEVSLTKEMKLGVEWKQTGHFYDGDYKYNQEASQKFDVGSLISQGVKYSILRTDGGLSAVVQALATDSSVNILSTPHIMTLNNQPATIRVGEEVPILTQTRNIEGGDTIRSFDYKSVAVELEVTPRINADRDVFMKVHPLVKKIVGFNVELNAPILATREAQTSVIVKDGQTVVIGGLMKDDKTTNRSKVPILGDIPLLGFFFRSHGTTKEKTELLVFLTPRVITTVDEAREVSRQKEGESKSRVTPYRLDAKAHWEFGRSLYRSKNYEEAITEWEQVLALSPDKSLRQKAERAIARAKKKSR